MKSIILLSKTMAVRSCAIIFSLCLFNRLHAQQCDTFYNVTAVNPIIRNGFDTYIWHPDFVDIDGDGDLDCYIRKYNDFYGEYAIPVLYRNIGTATTPVYTEDTASGFTPQNSYFSSEVSQFADIDGDGDLDYFVGEDNDNYSSSPYDLRIHFFKNEGTKSKPLFVEDDAENPLSFIHGYDQNYFTLADIDGDGDLDLYAWDDLGQYVYYNTGSATLPAYTLHSKIKLIQQPDRVYYDWNKDGLTDFFASSDAGIYTDYYRNIGPKSNPQYVLDETSGPVFNSNISGAPYRFVDLNKDGIIDMFDVQGNFFSVVNIAPAITASSFSAGRKTIYKLTGSPKQKGNAYQWRRNGKNIPGATAANIITPLKGYYTFTITNSCGTALSNPYEIGSTPAIAEMNTDALMANNVTKLLPAKAYPNPFTSEFVLQLPPTKGENIQIFMYDLQGRMVAQQETAAATVHLGKNLSTGVYVIKVIQNKSVILTQKIVKE